MGVGKSTTGRELFKYLHRYNIPRAFIPFDILRTLLSDREPTYRLKKIHTQNSILLANTFISEGYFTILEGVYTIQDLLDMLKKNIQGNYKLFRLTCDKDVCIARDAEVSDKRIKCGTDKINSVYDFFDKNVLSNPEEIILDNTNIGVDAVVEKIVRELQK